MIKKSKLFKKKIYKKVSKFYYRVYEVVSKIPEGRTLTYKQVAARAGRPGAYRAVGNILNKNNDPKVFCHRVIRSDGKIGGYNRGSVRKRELLIGEGVFVVK